RASVFLVRYGSERLGGRTSRCRLLVPGARIFLDENLAGGVHAPFAGPTLWTTRALAIFDPVAPHCRHPGGASAPGIVPASRSLFDHAPVRMGPGLFQ